MKLLKRSFFLSIALVFFLAPLAYAGYEYSVEKEHPGGDVTPIQACQMVQKDPQHTFLVDVRTRAEYQFVGHAAGAYNIPFMFLTNEVGKKGYKLTPNPDFMKDILARFNPATDTLLFYCRSGGRSCAAAGAAVKGGFAEDKIFSIMGGFEGGKNSNKESIYHGMRYYGGWRLEGLPCTYSMDKKLMYQPDIK